MEDHTHEHESCSTGERKSHHSEKTKRTWLADSIELKDK